MERKTERQLVCGKRACRNGLQSRSDLGRYHGGPGVVSTPKNPMKTGTKSRLADDRGIAWAIAINSTRICAPRRVLDKVFGHVPLLPPAAKPEKAAA
jgi:hypothetical protein